MSTHDIHAARRVAAPCARGSRTCITTRMALAGLLAGGLLTLSGCATESQGAGGFQRNYLAARGALEAGDYARANTQFAALMTSAGPFLPRVQLEYAHGLLRAGDHAGAAREATALADRSARARGAALAVAGTAQHELAKTALASGDTATGKAELLNAQASLAEVLSAYPDLDPLGALSARQAAITARLERL